MIQLTEILRIVSEASGYSIEELKGKRRFRYLVGARQMYCYIGTVKTKFSLTAIGREISDRDHTTILYARDVIAGFIDTQDEYTMHLINECRKLSPIIMKGICEPPPVKSGQPCESSGQVVMVRY